MKQITTLCENFETAFNSVFGFFAYVASAIVVYVGAYWGTLYGFIVVADSLTYLAAGQPIGLAGLALGIVIIRLGVFLWTELKSGRLGIPTATGLPAFAYSLTQPDYAE